MDTNQNILIFLTSRFPYPLNKGGKLRVFHQLKSLALDFEIHLICIDEKEPSQEAKEALAPYCASNHTFKLPKYKRIIPLIRSNWKITPLQVAYYYNRKIHRSIRKIIYDIQPTYIHCHLIRTVEYVKQLKLKTSISLDFMDAYASGMKKRADNTTNPLKKALFLYEKRKLRKYEKHVFKYAQRFGIISDQDRKAINNPLSFPIDIVPNGVDFTTFYPKKTVKKYDLVFMGNMTYPPNQVAVHFLINEIMPIILKKRPRTTLLIAGIGTPKSIKKYQNEQLHIVEHFEDISDSLAQSEIMVAPMLISIGLQNKIIQAMAMKVPCVISSMSNIPIGAEHGKSVLESTNPNQFATAILALLNSSEKRENLSENAYSFVHENYSWPQQASKLKNMILS